MKNFSRRAVLLVTLLTPSVALAAPTNTQSRPPAKHHRRLDGAVHVVVGGMRVAGALHGSPAHAPSTSAPAPAQQSSANGATAGSSFGNGSGTGNGGTSTPTPGSRVPMPSSGSQAPGRAASPSHGSPSAPTPPPVNGGNGGVSRNGGNGGSSGNNGGSTTGIGSAQQTLSMVEQALMTAAVIYQILHTDSAHNPHIPLPTHGTPTRGSTPSTGGSSTTAGGSSSSTSTDGNSDSSDDSTADGADDSSTTDGTDSTTDSSSPAHSPVNASAPNSTDAAPNAGAVATGKSPASADPTSTASAASDASSSGTPLKSSAPETVDGSSCELSKTKLPSVLDGTNAYCPTCVKGALDKLGDGIAQAAALSGGALRERDTIEQIVKIEESGVASGDYGAISADGKKVEYGAYQFSRASGQLQGVLRTYIQMQGADAKSTGVLKSYLHTLDSGAPLAGDHVFTDALRQAAKDPMMKKAQDTYFEREYVIPAVADASKMGLRSPLAAAVLVDLKTNGGYSSVVAAAKRAVPTIANADDEKKFIGALLDARDARYKALAAKAGLGQYLKTWLARDKDFRGILADGNTDLAGEVKLANGSFCGGNGDDARAFSYFMSKQQQGATGSGSGSSTPTLASI